jgi:hypothetical protein
MFVRELRRRSCAVLGLLAPALLALLLYAGSAGAVEAPEAPPAPWWRLSSRAAPTFLQQGDREDVVVVAASNLGDAEADGSKQISLTDVLPPGVIATQQPTGKASFSNEELRNAQMTCEPLPALKCTYANNVEPYERLEVRIPVEVASNATTGLNTVSVAGGGAASAMLSQPLTVKNQPTPFGVEQVSMTPETDTGAEDSVAGSHPFQLTTTLDLNQTLVPDRLKENEIEPSAPALLKDVHFRLPAGLIGNPKATPQCSNLDFATLLTGDINLCPSDTAVGVALVTINEPVLFPFSTEAVPLFNLAPAPGEPARFGFEVYNVPAILDTSVRADGEYRVEVSVENAPQTAAILGSQVTFWGEPGDKRHDNARGWDCVQGGHHAKKGEACTTPSPPSTVPFLSLPTSCASPTATALTGDSWLGDELEGSTSFAALSGCENVPFGPSIAVSAETKSASTPTGLKVNVKVPQETTLEAHKIAEGDVRDTTVVFPEGVQVSPSGANGLQACSEAQVGFKGINPETQASEFTANAPSCPDASKIGVVHIKTPLLADELNGGLYLAQQNANPFGSLIALYLVAEDPVSGVLVKLAGQVTLDQSTGRITSVFANTPQLPFEELEVDLFGGPRASVTSPPVCGGFATTALFTSWSGGPLVGSSSDPGAFDLESGPGGGACTSVQPFTPGFNAQSTNTAAGAFTPFTLNISRPDADQALGTVTTTLPAGIAAIIAAVTPCPEPQAAAGTCGAESLIGHTTASAGLGPEPFTAPQGQVFLTGSYKGAPFGLSIVTPAVAGPFNLGEVIVRAAISINPNTAAVTIVSDPLPTRLQGIPLQLQHINVTVDRPGFEFNPTSCQPKSIEGTITGAAGASAAVSSPFQVSNCAGLPFKPKIKESVTGQGSKADGVGFDVTLESAGLGQANIHKVDLTLPKALPSRLDTIQKACKEQIFNVNPAACDAGSVVGEGIVHTPVFKNPLRGPAYLVGHAGAEFPDVEFVLQGENVTIVLDGKTFIEKGVTFSRFETAPDAPFTKFEALLPAGPHSALGVESLITGPARNLCKVALSIPTKLEGQNGALIKETSKISITGCHGVSPSTSKKLTRAQMLKKALKACRRDAGKSRRLACEKQARKKFAPKKPAKRK